MKTRNRNFSILFPTFLSFFLVIHPAQSNTTVENQGGYVSLEQHSEGESLPGTVKKYYSMPEIENLNQALSPRYVRIFDWVDYGKSGNILNKGILFTYSSYRSRNVYLAGNFNNWNLIPMRRNSRGVFYYILPVREVEDGVRYNNELFSYRYKFKVDGIWTHDPSNQNRVDDGMGANLSEFRIESEDVNRHITVHSVQEELSEEEKLVEFSIYLPQVKNLSLVGNFNNWNPEHDLLVKGEDGIFRIRKRLAPGEYIYKFIADGKWILDTYNPYTRHFEEINELCSFIKIR